ncbi:MAG: ECF RNA polymerase sigma factor SigW [Anaerolineales bacterium]|nr:ECF RNA polymerase sigma factor SigW [Anaerolineales bacterium]
MKVFTSAHVIYAERMDTAESSLLISRCIAGDEYSIEMFVRQHEIGVFRLAISILRDRSEANEVTQETFIAAIKSLPSYQERSSLKAWVYTIALNISRSRLRKRKVLEKLKGSLSALFQVEAQKHSSPEDAVIQTEKEAAIWNALNELDEKHRIVTVLRYFQSIHTTEIAEILSISEGTVHSRLHTARERLRIALQHLHGD